MATMEAYLKNTKVKYQNLGLIDYKQAWDYQEAIFKQIVDLKILNRELVENLQSVTPNYILACEHPHVYTLGKSGKREHLLVGEDQLTSMHAQYYEINRGGDITYHGPGQLIVYLILDLDNFFTDIHKYLRLLEEAVIQTLAEFNINGQRSVGLTGVWVDSHSTNARKICAMGVRASRWVTMHGVALNVNTDLDYFNNIIPCGIQDKSVTSMAKEIGYQQNMSHVEVVLIEKLAAIFGMEINT